MGNLLYFDVMTSTVWAKNSLITFNQSSGRKIPKRYKTGIFVMVFYRRYQFHTTAYLFPIFTLLGLSLPNYRPSHNAILFDLPDLNLKDLFSVKKCEVVATQSSIHILNLEIVSFHLISKLAMAQNESWTRKIITYLMYHSNLSNHDL